jgi:hypothetical protein
MKVYSELESAQLEILSSAPSNAPLARAYYNSSTGFVEYRDGSAWRILVTTAGAQTLTDKILTSPDINGGTADALTSLSVRDTSAAFDLLLAGTSSTALDANRTLTIDVDNGSRTLALKKNLTVQTGNLTLTADSGGSSVTVPSTGTLATIGGTETFTDKTLTSPAINTPNLNGGTATASSRFLIPKETAANLTGLARVQTAIYYDTTNNVLKYDDGTNLNTLGTATAATPTVQGLVTSYEPDINSSTATVSSTTPVDLTATDGWTTIFFDPSGTDVYSVNLPEASTCIGKTITFKKIGNSTAASTINAYSGDNIEGISTQSLNAQGAHMTLFCVNSSTWRILNVYDYKEFVNDGGSIGKTLVDATPQTICSLALTPGTWSVRFHISGFWDNSLQGNFQLFMITTADSTSGILQSRLVTVPPPASDGYHTAGTGPFLISVTSNTTYYVNAYGDWAGGTAPTFDYGYILAQRVL